LKTPIILIHGTWDSADSWKFIKNDLENLGLKVITLSLRYHDLPYEEAKEKIGDVSITDYVSDIVDIVKQCDTPPILLGHSLGSLIAQMVAEQTLIKGMILLGPAPTADIFAFYPTMVRAFMRHFMQWGFWRKPMPPYKDVQYKLAMPQQSQALKEVAYAQAVPESGLVYTQMSLPFLDPHNTTEVNFNKINCPVLIITGSNDKLTVPQIAKATAKNYGEQATFIMMGDADHYYIAGKYKDQTVYHIKRWLENNERKSL